MTFSLIRLASAPLLAFAVVASCFAQVELRTQTLDPELSRRTGADDGFGLVITASADGRGSLETCGCGRQPLGGLARRVGYEKAVLELTQGGAGLVRLDAGGAFDDPVDTGRNEVIPHIRSEWVLRGYIARDVAAINVGITDLRYLSQMNVLQDRDAPCGEERRLALPIICSDLGRHFVNRLEIGKILRTGRSERIQVL